MILSSTSSLCLWMNIRRENCSAVLVELARFYLRAVLVDRSAAFGDRLWGKRRVRK